MPEIKENGILGHMSVCAQRKIVLTLLLLLLKWRFTVNVLNPKKFIWNQKRIIDVEWSSIRTVLTKRANLEKLNGCGLQNTIE